MVSLAAKLSERLKGKVMRKVLGLLIVIISAMVSVSAQPEQDLKRYFEGQTVSLKIDMPATREGLNVYPEREQALDYREYANRLKRHGTSIRRGDEIMITKVKVVDKQIEFQLGGGYGTIGDETNTDRLAQNARKSSRGKHETQKAQEGARFNLHFSLVDPRILPPEGLILALGKYVDFSTVEVADEDAGYLEVAAYSYPADEFKPGVVQVGPRTTYLKEGFSVEEVVRLLGKPSTVSERNENGVVVMVYEFPRGEGRVLIADFANGMLIHSTMEARGQVARADR